MTTKTLPKLGNVNARVYSVFKMGQKKLAFDGTTKNLVEVAIANGATTGTKLQCNFGGASYEKDFCDTIVIIEPDASGRMWVTRQWAEEKKTAAKTKKSSASKSAKTNTTKAVKLSPKEQDREWAEFTAALSTKQIALAKKLAKAMKDSQNREWAKKYFESH